MPPQAPYGDAESLFRAAHADLMRAAYALLGSWADTEDAAQNSCCSLMLAWDRVAVLRTADKQGAYLIRIVINEALQILRYPHRRWERLVDTGEYAADQESLDEKVEGERGSPAGLEGHQRVAGSVLGRSRPARRRL